MQKQYETVFNDYYKKLLASINIPEVEIDMPTEAELAEDISAFLRPSVDGAIGDRRSAADTGRAELDADAASRGMLGSTFVSSMKSRENTEAESDVAKLESSYAATLAERIFEAMNTAQGRKFEADTFNAGLRADAEKSAYDNAMSWLSLWLSSNSGGGSGRGGAGGAAGAEEEAAEAAGAVGSEGLPGMRKISYDICVRYLKTLSLPDAKNLFSARSEYWRTRRQEIRDSISAAQYAELRRRFGTAAGRGEEQARRNTYER